MTDTRTTVELASLTHDASAKTELRARYARANAMSGRTLPRFDIWVKHILAIGGK